MITAPEDDMSSPAAVAAIRPCHVVEFGMCKMPAPGAAMAGSTKDPDLVYKV